MNHRREGRGWEKSGLSCLARSISQCENHHLQAIFYWWESPGLLSLLSHPDSQVNENFRGVSHWTSLRCPFLFTRWIEGQSAVSIGLAGSAEKCAGRVSHLQPVLIAKPAGRLCHSVFLPSQLSGQGLVWKVLPRVIWSCCGWLLVQSRELLADKTLYLWPDPRMVLWSLLDPQVSPQ